MAIGLHPFEDFLRIMQHRRRRIERDRLARLKSRAVPSPLVGVVVDHDHVIGEDLPETGIGDRLLTGLAGDRGRVGEVLEIHASRVMREAKKGKWPGKESQEKLECLEDRAEGGPASATARPQRP